MTDLDLNALSQCGFSVPRIAHKLFSQYRSTTPHSTSPFSDAEHAYLLAHLDALPVEHLDWWISLRPRNQAARIIEAYLARKEANVWSVLDFQEAPRGWHPDEVEELCDQLFRREQARPRSEDLPDDPATMWRRWLPDFKGFAPLYHRLVALEVLPEMAATQRAAALCLWDGEAPLAAHLWPWRRDEGELTRRLVALTQELTTTRLRAAIYAWTCLEKLGLLAAIEHPASVLPSAIVWPAHPVWPVQEEPGTPAEGAARRQFVRVHKLRMPLSEQEHEGEFFRYLVLHWPEPGRAEANDWLVQQALRAAHAGTPWSVIWSVVPDPTLRARLGLASLDMPTPALFAGWALTTCIGGEAAFPWDAFFDWCERDARAFGPSGGVFEEAFGFPDAFERTGEHSGTLRLEFCPPSCAEQVLLRAPLPAAPDAHFVERFWNAVTSLHARSSSPMWPASWIDRLLVLPLDQAQARLLLEDFVRWPREDLEGVLASIVALAGPLSPSQCSPDKILCRRWPRDTIALYRLLTGPDADEALRQWMARDLDQAINGQGGSHQTFRLLRSHPELHTDELRQKMRAYVRSGPYRFAQQMRAEEPWLIDADELDQVALRCASSEREWAYDLEHYPASCLPALKERFCVLLRGWDEEALAKLGTWLRNHRVSTDDLISLWFDQGHEVRKAPAGVRWLVKLLSTRSGWDKHGKLVVTKSLEAGCPGLLVGICWELVLRPVSLPTPPPPGHPPAGVPVAAIHDALARVLIERIETALDDPDGDPSRLLRALFFLSPRSVLSQKFVGLQKRTRSAQFAVLMEACSHHLRRCKNEEASISDLKTAVAELSPPEDQDEEQASQSQTA